MIAEIIPGTFDWTGRKVLRPDLRKRGPHPTFPFGRYIAAPISVHCKSLEDVRRFLSTCRYVPDKKLFERNDYWQPPEEFEKTHEGDCDCFALWTWRQLVEMGYNPRFVIGRAGRYGDGHAWVMFQQDGKRFILEPMWWPIRDTLPRLSTIRYKPWFSAEWDGRAVHFYQHRQEPHPISMRQAVPLAADWLIFWTWFWVAHAPMVALNIFRKMTRKIMSEKASPQ